MCMACGCGLEAAGSVVAVAGVLEPLVVAVVVAEAPATEAEGLWWKQQLALSIAVT